jgi:DHA2 family multidrug resistance protein-like MFS transporter
MSTTTLAAPPESAPLWEDPAVYRRRWGLLGVMCLSLVLVVMAVSSLNVATPSMQQAMDATSTQLHWMVDAYAIVFAGLLLPAGALGDRYGRKGALLLGLAIFALGLVVTGIADAPTQVIVGRGIMGAGSAFVMPATLSLITAIFPPEERIKAIATWSGFAGAGGAIGPIMSGALLERFWWGSTVLVNLPVVAITAGVILLLSPRSRDSRVTPLDPIGAVVAVLGVVSLVYGIIEGANRGWTDSLVIGAFVAAGVLLSGFVAWERRAPHPMLPMNLFADRRFSVGSGVITLCFFCAFGLFFLSTLYMQYVLEYSTLATGLATLPWAGAVVLSAPRSAGLGERFGPATVIAGGFAVIALGFAILTQLTTHSPYIVLAFSFAVMGSGMGLVFAPATGGIMSAVPLDKAGVGSAVNDTTRELGAALGVAVLGTVLGSVYRASVDLSGEGLSAAELAQAEESIGGAVNVGRELPEGGGALIQQAQEAFVDAFRVTNLLSVAVTLAAGAMVLVTLRRRRIEATASAMQLESSELPPELRPAEATG